MAGIFYPQISQISQIFFGGSTSAGKGKSNRKAHPFLIDLSEQNIHEGTFLNEPSTLISRHHLKVICVVCGQSFKPKFKRYAPTITSGTRPKSQAIQKNLCNLCNLWAIPQAQI
jgi:hypothetical protein